MIKIQINFENREGESETYSFPPLKENHLPPLPLPSTGFNVPAINHCLPTTASTTDLYRKHAIDSRLLTLFDFHLVRGYSIRHFIDKTLVGLLLPFISTSIIRPSLDGSSGRKRIVPKRTNFPKLAFRFRFLLLCFSVFGDCLQVSRTELNTVSFMHSAKPIFFPS